MLLLYSERALTSRWGVRVLDPKTSISASSKEEALDSACSELSCRYSLSPREDEILRLLVAGKSGTKIEKELLIAAGTFKAHTSHIYEKMGINNRKQLVDIVNAAIHGR